MTKVGLMIRNHTRASGQNQAPALARADTNSKALKFAAKKSTEEPKKSPWHSVFYGLIVGTLSFLMKFLPEKVGKFLSKIIPPAFKTDNPFAAE